MTERHLALSSVSSDGVAPTVGFAYTALGMDKGVVYNVVPGCTVRVLKRLGLNLKEPLVRVTYGKNVKFLPVRVERRVGIQLRVKALLGKGRRPCLSILNVY